MKGGTTLKNLNTDHLKRWSYRFSYIDLVELRFLIMVDAFLLIITEGFILL